MLTTAHMEHGLPLLAGLDLGALMGARVPAAAPEPAEMESGSEDAAGVETGAAQLLEVLGKAGQERTIRRLGMIQRATVSELLEMESSPKKAAEMEVDAASRPYAENFRDALRFFGELGASLSALTSSDAAEGEAQPDQHQVAGSHSEG